MSSDQWERQEGGERPYGVRRHDAALAAGGSGKREAGSGKRFFALRRAGSRVLSVGALVTKRNGFPVQGHREIHAGRDRSPL